MPSTSPSLELSLRRADLIAFWAVTTATVATVVGVAAMASGARTPWLWSLSATAMLVPGVVWPPWFAYGVRAWNKGARLCSVALRAYVLRVCYYAFFGGLSRAGSALDLSLGNAQQTRWVPHGRTDPSARGESGDSEQWAGGLPAASARPGAGWMLVLVPVMALLRVLSDQQVQSAPASSTYTLY